jgi:phenylalanine-4-hydroxylase
MNTQLILDDARLARRKEHIISLATGPVAPPKVIDYLPHEHKVWETVSTTLRPLWDKSVAVEVLEAREALRLPVARVPQLTEVSKQLAPLSGFSYHAVGGLVPIDDFFGALGRKSFLSTQYLRHPKSPLYTPEPDIIHEVIGHATCLADPKLARLHQLAGEALVRVSTKQAKQFIANIWWFSGEFGVIREGTKIKAFGAGLLSSVGELESFTRQTTVLPVDILKMGTTPYRIDAFQKTLFATESTDHLLLVVGGFFSSVTDLMVEDMLRK